MNYVDLALRWMHILAAITLVGGTLFLRFVWYPAHRRIDYRDREVSFQKLRPAWGKLIMLSTLFLLVSGLVNAVNNIRRYEFGADSPYAMLIAAKLLLAFALFFLSARVAGRSESATMFREKIGKWLTINTVLALLLVGIAGYMKVTPREAKLIEEAPVATLETSVDVAEPAAP